MTGIVAYFAYFRWYCACRHGSSSRGRTVTRPGRMPNLFTAPDLHVTGVQEQGMAAELVHSYLERDVGPGRGLFEDHGERLAGKQQVLCPGLFLALDTCASFSRCSSSSSSISRIEIKSFFIAVPSYGQSARLSDSCVPISRRWRTFPFTPDAADSAAFSAP